MSTLPKYLISDNPMEDADGEFVVHTQKPRFIARFIPGESSSNFEIVEEIDNFSEYFNGDMGSVAKLMRDLGEWFEDYSNWEDANYLEE